MHADHPLVGTWVVANELSSIEFRIRATPRGFRVNASDSNDGEQFVVSDTRWAAGVLRFRVFVPSSKTQAEHTFRLRRDGTIEDRFTALYVDKLVRKASVR